MSSNSSVKTSKQPVETQVCGSKPDKHKNMRFKKGRWLKVVNKLDEVQVMWLVRTRRNGTMSTKEVAEHLDISPRWVQKLCLRYRNVKISEIKYPQKMGRPVLTMPGRTVQSAVLANHEENRRNAVRLEKIIKNRMGIHIPHRTIHNILKTEKIAKKHPKKSRRRKWIRYERRYSNSLWHTDYKTLPDGRYFVSYMDDASRLIVGFGVFDEQTTENAITVLKKAIEKYGKPAGMLTDHGSQFYSNLKVSAERGKSEFEKKLAELGIKHSMARIRHPQTNGKIERFHSEIKQHLKSFELESVANTVRGSHTNGHVGNPFNTRGPTDPVTRLVEWYNNLEHMALKDEIETPTQAFVRKQAPKGISEEAMREDIHAKC